MNFNDLTFEPCPAGQGGMARVEFPNGYGAIVLQPRPWAAELDMPALHSIYLLKDGHVISPAETDIPEDVLGDRCTDGIASALQLIASLDKHGGLPVRGTKWLLVQLRWESDWWGTFVVDRQEWAGLKRRGRKLGSIDFLDPEDMESFYFFDVDMRELVVSERDLEDSEYETFRKYNMLSMGSLTLEWVKESMDRAEEERRS